MISITHNFVSITQFFDFWVMSYGNWKLILGVFNFQNSVSNGIFVIKHTCMRPTVSAKSHRVLLLTNPPMAPSQSSHQKSTHTKISHIQPQSSFHAHPQPNPTLVNPRRPELKLANVMPRKPRFFNNLSSPRKPRFSTK